MGPRPPTSSSLRAPLDRWDARIAAALGLLVVVTRWPRRAGTLTMWDSVWFALGLERYDVAASQPHPPGYPVFIGLAKVVQWFERDPREALLLVNLLFTLAAVVCLYLLMRARAGRLTSALGTGLFVLAPVFWFNGVVPLSYTAEAAASVIVAWLAWRTRERATDARAAILAASWAFALGIRPSLLFFLTPVVAYGLWPLIREPRRLVPAASAAGIAIGVWILPAGLLMPGGFGAWIHATSLQSRHVVFAHTAFADGWAAIAANAARLDLYLRPERGLLIPAVLALAAGVALARLRPAPPPTARPAAAFLAAWLLPSLLFYLLIFDGLGSGPSGYVLTFLPGLYVVYAWLFDDALRRFRAWRPRAAPLVVAVSVPLLLWPAPAFVETFDAEWRREVRGHDDWAASWSQLPGRFPPNETAILTWYNWAHVKWYFPEYTAWTYLPVAEPGASDWILVLETRGHRDDRRVYEARGLGHAGPAHPAPAEILRIVLFDFQLAGENGGIRRIDETIPIHEAFLENGWRVLYIETDGRPTVESYFRDLPDAAHLTDDFRI